MQISANEDSVSMHIIPKNLNYSFWNAIINWTFHDIAYVLQIKPKLLNPVNTVGFVNKCFPDSIVALLNNA